jgi:hypothetical protein
MKNEKLFIELERQIVARLQMLHSLFDEEGTPASILSVSAYGSPSAFPLRSIWDAHAIGGGCDVSRNTARAAVAGAHADKKEKLARARAKADADAAAAAAADAAAAAAATAADADDDAAAAATAEKATVRPLTA